MDNQQYENDRNGNTADSEQNENIVLGAPAEETEKKDDRQTGTENTESIQYTEETQQAPEENAAESRDPYGYRQPYPPQYQQPYPPQYQQPMGFYQNPYTFQPQNQMQNPYQNIAAPIKQKKQKRGASKAFVIIAVCLCILLSGTASYFASALAVRKAGTGTSSDGKGTPGSTADITYHYSDEEKPDVTDYGDAAYVAEKCAPSVVEVTTESVSTSTFFGQYITSGAGSGVIISENGYIVTCAHVVQGASKINVTLSDGKKLTSELVGIDSSTDIAVLKVNADGLKSAVIGKSADLKVGQRVVAIGNPLGTLGGTVTEGIISALDREIEIEGQKYTLLQTNAAINPGNSGGALFNADGSLIGIVNAKSTGDDVEGLGFAIPIDRAMDIAQKLMKDGYITGRAKIGVMLFEIKSQSDIMNYWEYKDYITDYGVYIAESEVEQLHPGDRVIAFNGITVASVSELKSLVLDCEVGDVVKMTISRVNSKGKSEIKEVEVTLLEKTAEDQ